MRGDFRTGLRLTAAAILGLSGAIMVRRPEWTPPAVLICLATTTLPLARAWRSSRGTALRWVVPWAGLAVGLGMVGPIIALTTHRVFAPWAQAAGEFIYLSALATLATMIAVLNARRPGAGAWAILMGLMILILNWFPPEMPHPHISRLAGREWPVLEDPFTLFLLMLMFVGLTNFAFTRFWLTAVVLGASLRLSIYPMHFPGEFAGPWLLAVAAWLAEAQSSRWEPAASGLDRLWLWFRNYWGIVWALRVMERFNRSAESAGWPIRLSWYGAEPVEGTGPPAIPEGAEATLKGLLRRFADADRLDAEAAGESPTLR